MNGQSEMFGRAPCQKHSQTSVDAAERIGKHMNALHARVYFLLCRHPKGLTDEQIQTSLSMNPST